MRRLQISLEPEQRCEQTEDREREHWLETVAYRLQPKERKDMKEKEKRKLKRYTVSSMSGKPVGSIGNARPVSVDVMAESPDEALLEAYHHIEHLSKPQIREIYD